MFEKQIKSKVYIEPKRNNALIVIVSIFVIITAILGIVSVINDGVKIDNISPIIMALVVGIGVFGKSNAKPYYNFDVATITIAEQLTIDYQDSKLQIIFNTREINLLQYSDQLKCLRIVGNYTRKEKNKVATILNEEYLLYVGDGEEIEIIKELESKGNFLVEYMDR